jgi:hypothetical protein
MKKGNKILKFGEDVEGYTIPVLNEREIRAAAGILFVFMLTSFLLIMFKQDFILIKYVIVIFLTDLLIRVLISPKYSPTLIIGRLIVRNQVPEYVGAIQKKFAWVIGIFLASVMFILLVLENSYSPITGIGCLICLNFLFFESAFGICLGCKVYKLIYKEKAQYCPGEVCDVKAKHDIQKTSLFQVLIVAALAAYITLISMFLNDEFAKKPHNLFGVNNSEITK